MTTPPHFTDAHGTTASENYERYFVPAIGRPAGEDLLRAAALRENERVLDVACGTGIVARLAAEQVGPGGRVAGLDANAGMLNVARTFDVPGRPIEWYEAGAESMPLPDESFDVVLCQYSFQFFADKQAALREMRRVLAPGGRLLLSVPGPIGPLFESLADAMDRNVGAQAAGFVRHVFSVHEPNELRRLLTDAGLRNVVVETSTRIRQLPAAREFLWQYVRSTPLAGPVLSQSEEALGALERDVIARWREFEKDGHLTLEARGLLGRGFR